MANQGQDQEINIIALEYPDNIRTRTGMYLGSIENPNVCLREIIDNSIDELFGCSTCDKVDIQIESGRDGGWYVIADSGRGIPIIMDETRNITKTDLAMTTINAGSKFTKTNVISVGMNGVGASAVNATCERFIVFSKITKQNHDKSIPQVKELYNKLKEEIFYFVEYSKGVKVDEGANTREALMNIYGFDFPKGMSTITGFIPDLTIWRSNKASYNWTSLSYLKIILDKFYHKNCNITVDHVEMKYVFHPFKFEFVTEVREDDRYAQFYINFEVDSNLSTHDTSGSINSLTVNRGLHINWAELAYQRALTDYYNLQHSYTYAGLKLNVIVLSPDVDFSSQTKENCTKISGFHLYDVQKVLVKQFTKIFKANSDYFDTHIARLNEYAMSLSNISAISKVKQLVGTVEGGGKTRSKLPSSVKDASSNEREKCELYIVEGKSASGTMLKCRDAEYHALLELRGVPLNSINLDLDTIMENEEMRSIILAIGAGVNEYFRIENCRYGKIILAADSDIDGSKINSMILGFIAKKMTFLIEDGRVFIALAPLYHQGNTYVYPGEDPEKILDYNKPFKRYKGIGEINTAEARDFYFNENRRLIKILPTNLEYVFKLLSYSSYRKDLMIDKGIVIDKYGTGIV